MTMHLAVAPVSTSPTATAPGSVALRRISWSFSRDGRAAACLAGPGDGTWHVETWTPGAAHGAPVALASGRPEALTTQLLALSSDVVLMCRHEPGRHELVLLGREGAGIPAGGRVLKAPTTPGLRLLPYPGRDALALAIGTDTTPSTTIWRILRDGALDLVAELPGLHGGGVWLDLDGHHLALDAVGEGRVKTSVVDLTTGTCGPLLEMAESSNDRLRLCDPLTGLMVVSSDAPGHDRLGWVRLASGRGEQARIRFPDIVNLPNTTVRPLAIAPDGERVALQLDRGAGSQLAVWSPERGTISDLPMPGGCLGGSGHWSVSGLHVPYSAPDRPSGLATVVPERPGSWRLLGSTPPPGGTDEGDTDGEWRPAHLELLTGATGGVETIVYGGQDWRTAQHVVLALHGGPAAAWRFEFDPMLQRLARCGMAVAAPNQRGSTGYGTAYAHAVHGAWGGPDLADIAAIGRTIAAERDAAGLSRPALFGTSYGAYLALLAAATEPDAWSCCLAVAPFLSGPRLIAEASLPVRALMTRLGGDHEYTDDEHGPRDVLRLCERITAPLLVVHGDRDDTIPVGQSRSLRHELLGLERAEGTDFRYLELPGQGHDVLTGDGAPALHTRLAAFLRTHVV